LCHSKCGWHRWSHERNVRDECSSHNSRIGEILNMPGRIPVPGLIVVNDTQGRQSVLQSIFRQNIRQREIRGGFTWRLLESRFYLGRRWCCKSGNHTNFGRTLSNFRLHEGGAKRRRDLRNCCDFLSHSGFYFDGWIVAEIETAQEADESSRSLMWMPDWIPDCFSEQRRVFSITIRISDSPAAGRRFAKISATLLLGPNLLCEETSESVGWQNATTCESVSPWFGPEEALTRAPLCKVLRAVAKWQSTGCQWKALTVMDQEGVGLVNPCSSESESESATAGGKELWGLIGTPQFGGMKKLTQNYRDRSCIVGTFPRSDR
jgi:hypothetical protein